MEPNRAPIGSHGEVARARRYPIGTVLRYRVRGEQEWREGVMENISISGVLIHASQVLETNTLVELRFALPVELNNEVAAEVLCRGWVVRSAPRSGPAGSVSMAVRIAHSRFLRQMTKKEEFAGD
ncbi:MAG: PilZ domain-containing protein [Acidobacteriaceae bacterium]